jgi:hypothetical protein
VASNDAWSLKQNEDAAWALAQGLPTLYGTPKQCAWANVIRRKKLVAWAMLLRTLVYDLTPLGADHFVRHLTPGQLVECLVFADWFQEALEQAATLQAFPWPDLGFAFRTCFGGWVSANHAQADDILFLFQVPSLLRQIASLATCPDASWWIDHREDSISLLLAQE